MVSHHLSVLLYLLHAPEAFSIAHHRLEPCFVMYNRRVTCVIERFLLHLSVEEPAAGLELGMLELDWPTKKACQLVIRGFGPELMSKLMAIPLRIDDM